ncbi:hypothetical protein GFM44_11825 [Rhizobium leguminosarum bv. viciae]|nr:hypothetical protein [Rhizobium leguminosarum bv. viciae]
MTTRSELDEATVERYRSSCQADKRPILDELVAGRGDRSYACNHQADLPKDGELTPIRKNVA